MKVWFGTKFGLLTDFRRKYKMSYVSLRIGSVHVKWTRMDRLLFSERNRHQCGVYGWGRLTFVFRKGLN